MEKKVEKKVGIEVDEIILNHPQTRKLYESPQLIALGNVEDLTRDWGGGSVTLP